MIARPGLGLIVAHLYKEEGESGKGVIQRITVDVDEGISVTGAYKSPTVTGEELQQFLSAFNANGKGADVLIRDLNTRRVTWERVGNVRGRALVSRIGGTRHNVWSWRGQRTVHAGGGGPATQIYWSQT